VLIDFLVGDTEVYNAIEPAKVKFCLPFKKKDSITVVKTL
jgi:hypothetical protein